MSWIQENRFAAGLGGITAVAAVGLIAWGVSAGNKYNQAKDEFATASSAVSSMKNGPLFPDEDNLSAKKKAVEEYDKSVKDLQALFKPFAAATPPNIEPDAFSESLAKAKETVAKAFEQAKTEIPAEFFLGYESFTQSPVKKEATGILTYEMEAIAELLTNLAAAAPAKLINIHRPPLEEEDGKTFDPKGKTYRALPVEISFNGNEATLRKFLSSLDDSGKYYFVVRSMRVMNEKSEAPTAADGNFKTEEDEAAAEDGAAGGDPFGGAGGFVLPEEEPAEGDKPAEEEDKPAEGDAPAETPAESAPAAGDEKILQDVLGAEKINVFLRIDILQFLEAKTP
jgi:hypothetical protein